MISLKILLFVAFFIWSFPVWKYRNDFRKMAYRTDDWKINIQPRFWTELKVLFGFEKRDTPEEKKIIRFYRWYMLGYFILFFGWLFA